MSACYAGFMGRMIRFEQTLAAWGAPAFEPVLKEELERLTLDELPLQQGMVAGSHALKTGIQAMILSASETEEHIVARAGIFYRSIIAGCSCADDPTPIDECNEYCEVELKIDKATAETTIALLPL